MKKKLEKTLEAKQLVKYRISLNHSVNFFFLNDEI